MLATVFGCLDDIRISKCNKQIMLIENFMSIFDPYHVTWALNNFTLNIHCRGLLFSRPLPFGPLWPQGQAGWSMPSHRRSLLLNTVVFRWSDSWPSCGYYDGFELQDVGLELLVDFFVQVGKMSVKGTWKVNIFFSHFNCVLFFWYSLLYRAVL